MWRGFKKKEKEKRRSKIEYQCNEIVYNQIWKKAEKLMKDGKYYLDPSLSLNDFSSTIGSNRTYVSKAFKHNNTNFRQFVNRYRLEELFAIVEDAHFERNYRGQGDDDIVASEAGFTCRRSMDVVLKRELGKTYSKICKDKKSRVKN